MPECWADEVTYEMKEYGFYWNCVSCASADRVATDDFLMDRYKTVYNTLVWRYIRGLHKGRRWKTYRNIYRK